MKVYIIENNELYLVDGYCTVLDPKYFIYGKNEGTCYWYQTLAEAKAVLITKIDKQIAFLKQKRTIAEGICV